MSGIAILKPGLSKITASSEYIETSMQSFIVINDITWTFDTQYEVGQFCNGDYFVIDSGSGVNIISISPASEYSGGYYTNGSMINPEVSTSVQGFDSTSGYLTYTHSLNVGYGISGESPLNVTGGESLISTKSSGISVPVIEAAEILTVLDEVPLSGSFRPAYTGSKIIHNKNDLNYNLLLSLTSTANTPSLSTVIDYVQRPWIDFITAWSGNLIHPSDNMPNYGRDLCSRLGIASLMLHLDFTNAQKEPLLINLVQKGIDFYGIASSGSGWPPDGGHNSGRKWPILFAGIMLNDTNMKNIGQKSGDYLYSNGYDVGNNPPDYISFGEDSQTFYVTAGDVTRTHEPTWDPSNNNGNGEWPYDAGDIGMPEWGINHSLTGDHDNRSWLADYRAAVGIATSGHVLSARMMESGSNAKTLWNHNSLFDYQDRYMLVTAGEDDGYTVEEEETGNRAYSTFEAEMWDTYRSSY